MLDYVKGLIFYCAGRDLPADADGLVQLLLLPDAAVID